MDRGLHRRVSSTSVSLTSVTRKHVEETMSLRALESNTGPGAPFYETSLRIRMVLAKLAVRLRIRIALAELLVRTEIRMHWILRG